MRWPNKGSRCPSKAFVSSLDLQSLFCSSCLNHNHIQRIWSWLQICNSVSWLFSKCVSYSTELCCLDVTGHFVGAIGSLSAQCTSKDQGRLCQRILWLFPWQLSRSKECASADISHLDISGDYQQKLSGQVLGESGSWSLSCLHVHIHLKLYTSTYCLLLLLLLDSCPKASKPVVYFFAEYSDSKLWYYSLSNNRTCITSVRGPNSNQQTESIIQYLI